MHGAAQIASAVVENPILLAIEPAWHVNTTIDVRVSLAVKTKDQALFIAAFKSDLQFEMLSLGQLFTLTDGKLWRTGLAGHASTPLHNLGPRRATSCPL